MKKIMIASLIGLGMVSGSAFAEDVYGYQVPVTRTQVKQEIAQARADGTLNTNDVNYPILKQEQPSQGLTREQVKADIVKARQEGKLPINRNTYPDQFLYKGQ